MSCLEAFDLVCRKIVCPTKHNLNEPQMIERKFRNKKIEYELVTIMNRRGQALSAIVFPQNFKKLPTVLYLHGNGGYKLQCLQLSGYQFNLISFDFSGCGKSQGRFVTYGEQEVQDIDAVVKWVQKKYKIRKIVLWGRSMGASLALMYASFLHSKDIICMVLDTPFRKLKQVITNVAKHNKEKIPNFLINFAVYLVQRKVTQITGINVFQTDFMMHLNLIKDIPILFGYSPNDCVVHSEDVIQLYDNYLGPKILTKIQLMHHQDRPKQFIQQAISFIIEDSQNFSTSNLTMQNGKRGILLSMKNNQ